MKLPINYNQIHPKYRYQVRNAYIQQQKGLCYYCGKSLEGKPADEVMQKDINEDFFPTNFFKWPVHLHHNHETGMTIGAVHCHCNAVLFQYDGI